MTKDKPYWLVPFTIEGEMPIPAESSAEARIKFRQFTKTYLAELYGELVEHTPLKMPDDYDHDAASEGIDRISG